MFHQSNKRCIGAYCRSLKAVDSVDRKKMRMEASWMKAKKVRLEWRNIGRGAFHPSYGRKLVTA